MGKAEPEVGTVLAIGLPGGGGAAVLTGRAIFAQRVRCWLGPALVLSAAVSFALTLLSCVALFGAWGGATLLTAHNRSKRCFGTPGPGLCWALLGVGRTAPACIAALLSVYYPERPTQGAGGLRST